MTAEQQTPPPDKVQEGDYTIEVVENDPATLAMIVGAEIDVQIATAKKYPRSIAIFLKKALSLATIDQETAESCEYGLPRAGKIITGPSIRLAEIIYASYGNCRAGARIVNRGRTTITAQGVFHDLESNAAVTIEVTRSIMEHEKKWDNVKGKYVRTGRMVPMNEDMQTLAGNAAASIALRNAIFRGVPKASWNSVYKQAQITARGDAATLPARREKALAWFAEKGVKVEQILRILDVRGVEDIDLERLQTLSTIKAAVVNNEATLENIFPSEQQRANADAATKAAEDKINKKSGGRAGAKKTEQKLTDDLAKKNAPGGAEKPADS
jgi:hypothetical protein